VSNIRVKDLAKELGVGNKEILQILRELGIQAKSQMGALTDEEASQVRLKARAMGGQTQVIDTEVQPGVIVRRRKPARDRQVPEPEAAPAAEAKKPEPVSVVSETPLEPERAPRAVPSEEIEKETATEDMAPPRKKRPAKPAPVETPPGSSLSRFRPNPGLPSSNTRRPSSSKWRPPPWSRLWRRPRPFPS
jgi:translation initiation factor IF-2